MPRHHTTSGGFVFLISPDSGNGTRRESLQRGDLGTKGREGGGMLMDRTRCGGFCFCSARATASAGPGRSNSRDRELLREREATSPVGESELLRERTGNSAETEREGGYSLVGERESVRPRDCVSLDRA